MRTSEYYNHCRTLGNFAAQDCISLAREAAELDRQSQLNKIFTPSERWLECLPNGDNTLRLSNGIKCF